MSEAFFQRSVSLSRRDRADSARPLPRGYGLLIATALSLAIWSAVVWGVWRVVT